MKLIYCLFPVSIFFLIGCAQSIQTDRAYQELGRSEHFKLVENGYIIGLEKKSIKTNKVLLPGLPIAKGYSKRFQQLNENVDNAKKLNSEYRSKTEGQQKVMLATQMTSNFPHIEFLYNAYGNRLSGEFNYEKSFAELDLLFNDLTERLNNTNAYSHIIIMSMGWNNDQLESVYRYNKILKNIKEASKPANNAEFKPLVIALTWPSVWYSLSDSWLKRKLGHLLSYPNKSDDADEIGYTWANWIINKKLPESIEIAKAKGLIKENTPKVVVIGHSFGARVLSRALFSSEHLKFGAKEGVVDVFIGLQGAFSIKRFLPGEGLEGSPYSNFKKLDTKIILTSSLKDSSNSSAAFLTRAHNVGGKYGLKAAVKYKDIFDNKVWNKNIGKVPLPIDKVLMLDASSIVVGDEEGGKKYSPHNDILDQDMGELIWNFIN
ncbi:hypothetical protein WN093_12260 [Gammaproteobacteria bacterium AS21]